MSDLDGELRKKYPLWLALLATFSTYSIMELSMAFGYPYWQGAIAALAVVFITYQIWFKIRDYQLKKSKSNFKSGIKKK